jgi:spore maturation protein CgeB
MFEALACGIPLISAPWTDAENLFPRGSYITARDGAEMAAALSLVLCDRALADNMADTGLSVIRLRHTCAHRVRELFSILESIGAPSGSLGRQPQPEACAP